MILGNEGNDEGIKITVRQHDKRYLFSWSRSCPQVTNSLKKFLTVFFMYGLIAAIIAFGLTLYFSGKFFTF
jgi:hypothetical protein